jgi:hypothetical protein
MCSAAKANLSKWHAHSHVLDPGAPLKEFPLVTAKTTPTSIDVGSDVEKRQGQPFQHFASVLRSARMASTTSS